MKWKIIIIALFFVIDIIAFCMYGADKKKAQNNKWRISEKTLLLLALFGGAYGAALGMKAFRHKTRHGRFLIIVPLSVVIKTVVLAAVCWYL